MDQSQFDKCTGCMRCISLLEAGVIYTVDALATIRIPCGCRLSASAVKLAQRQLASLATLLENHDTDMAQGAAEAVVDACSFRQFACAH